MKKSVRYLHFTLTSLLIFGIFLLELFALVGGAFLILLWLFYCMEGVRFLFVVSLLALRFCLVALCVVTVSNGDMIAEGKTAWLTIVALFGLIGVFSYFILARPVRRKEKVLAPKTKGAFTEELGAFTAFSPLITSTQRLGAPVRSGTRTKYFSSGEAYFSSLLTDIKSAKKFIYLEYFILERGVTWNTLHAVLKEKVREGVEVRLIYDDLGTLFKLPLFYDKTLRKEGIDCKKFAPFLPVLSNVHDHRDHRKIAVIDGVVGYTGGANLADEYVNAVHPFGRWKDSALRLEGDGVKDLLSLFLSSYALVDRKRGNSPTPCPEIEETEAPCPDQKDDPSTPCPDLSHGLVQVFGDGPSPFYRIHVAKKVYSGLIDGAKSAVDVVTPYLILSEDLKNAFLRATGRGVRVRILTPHVPDKKFIFSLTRASYLALVQGGVEVYEYTPGFVHAKVVLADGEVATVGTANFDFRSLVHHFECGVVLYKTPSIESIKLDMEESFRLSEKITEQRAEEFSKPKLLTEWGKAFSALF